MTKSNVTYKEAASNAGALIFQLIKELAVFEKLSHEVTATQELIEEALFGANPKAFCYIADVSGEPAGFALCFYNYSTFQGKSGIYIEDIYIREEYRGHGIGKVFFAVLAEKAVKENCGRVQWSVLDWNIQAIDFYKKLGANVLDDWRICRLEGNALMNLQTPTKKVA